MNPRIAEMLEELINARLEVQPSQFWTELNKKNIEQLEKDGYENFKRTVVTNYFTWLLIFRDAQFRFLLKNVAVTSLPRIALSALMTGSHRYFPRGRSLAYNFLTYLLWQYLSQNDPEGIRQKLAEPEEGNPARVWQARRLISQDLANSALEYLGIMGEGIDPKQIKTILELGAGYGRTAYVFLTLMPGVRYIIADIPPALYVAERYLSSQFRQRRIFKFRKFSNYSDIKEEFESAEIAFFLPHQLELLPDKTADLFVNISSLHEMRRDQIDYYFHQIDRLTKHYFYFKQWKLWHNTLDNLWIGEKDYPIPDHWTQCFWRDCRVQTYFFEALFSL